MTGEVEVFLDEIPGETRGVIVRDGRFERLLIQREGDSDACRLGARSIGRITQVHPGLKAAFVEIPGTDLSGFLPLNPTPGLGVGSKVEVVVVSEPRETKGPRLRWVNPGEGAVRLLSPGPTVIEQLGLHAPGVPVETGIAAQRAGLEAEQDALSTHEIFAAHGLDLAIQRTRALIAVDIDHTSLAGQGPGKARRMANVEGLKQAARIIGLKRWAGLVAVDLAGHQHDAAAISAVARMAFGSDPDIVLGPLNRFGVLQLSLPWRLTPIEEVLNDASGQPSVRTRALAVVRALKHSLTQDTATPRYIARCRPEVAVVAQPLVARLGPRAGVRSDPDVDPMRPIVQEG